VFGDVSKCFLSIYFQFFLLVVYKYKSFTKLRYFYVSVSVYAKVFLKYAHC